MTYDTPQALRAALEQRLLIQSAASGISLDRLRRRVVFERVVARLQVSEPGRWVLKGGMALEVRLRDRARLTKDVDLGLRESVEDGSELHERIVDSLAADPYGDKFIITAAPLVRLAEDGAGFVTWRSTIRAQLAGKEFGSLKLDISPRVHELTATEEVPLPNSLAFASVQSSTIEIIDVQRHAAEKFHAMQRDFGDRDNSRVRDLVDLVILHENGLLDPPRLSVSIRSVWQQRERADPPTTIAAFPSSWPDRYEQLAREQDLEAQTFPSAVAITTRLWAEMFMTKEN